MFLAIGLHKQTTIAIENELRLQPIRLLPCSQARFCALVSIKLDMNPSEMTLCIGPPLDYSFQDIHCMKGKGIADS